MYPNHHRDAEVDASIVRTQLATASLLICMPVVLFVGGVYSAAYGGPVGLWTFATTVTAIGLVLAFAAVRASLGLYAVLVALVAVAFCVLGLVESLRDYGGFTRCDGIFFC